MTGQAALRRVYGLYCWIVGVSLFLLLAPLVMAAPRLSWRRRLARVSLKALFITWLMRWRISGFEHFPDKPCIVVSNHTSYLDGMVLQMLLPPRVSFAIMEEVRGLPPVHFLLERLGATFISRGDAGKAAQQTRHMLRKLHEGDSLGIFAEGRMARERPNELQPFRRGAFMLAAHGGGVPVVPVLIRGPEKIFPPGSKWLRPGRVAVTVLAPVPPAGTGKNAAEAVRDLAHARLRAALQNNAP
ncbi:MAG: lysophospholipid acyltransferase family protein [Nevskiales bacterium]